LGEKLIDDGFDEALSTCQYKERLELRIIAH